MGFGDAVASTGPYTPCPEKNETNNILGITLTKFNKFSQLLAQFMLTCQLTKNNYKKYHYSVHATCCYWISGAFLATGTFSSRIVPLHIELELLWSSWKEKHHGSFRRYCGL